MSTSIAIKLNTSKNTAVITGDVITALEVVSVAIKNYGSVTDSDVLLEIYNYKTLVASCNEFTENVDQLEGSLDLRTDELKSIFRNFSGSEELEFTLHIWDAGNNNDLCNDKIKIQNNPSIGSSSTTTAAAGIGNVSTDESSTTENYIPLWSSVARKLKNGVRLLTSTMGSLSNEDTDVPTAKTIRTYAQTLVSFYSTIINANTSARHTHSNTTALGKVKDSGSGSGYLTDDGTYKFLPDGVTPALPANFSGEAEKETLADADIGLINDSADSNAVKKFTLANLASYIQSKLTSLHTHGNKDLLDTYDQTNTALSDAVTKKHEHSNKTTLDKINSAVVPVVMEIPETLDSASDDLYPLTNGCSFTWRCGAKALKYIYIKIGTVATGTAPTIKVRKYSGGSWSDLSNTITVPSSADTESDQTAQIVASPSIADGDILGIQLVSAGSADAENLQVVTLWEAA